MAAFSAHNLTMMSRTFADNHDSNSRIGKGGKGGRGFAHHAGRHRPHRLALPIWARRQPGREWGPRGATALAGAIGIQLQVGWVAALPLLLSLTALWAFSASKLPLLPLYL